MTLAEDVDLRAFEGLIRATAARYHPFLDEDFEDIEQVLRIKVWQAVCSYRPERATQPLERYVFSCVRNRVKDLLKEQSRRVRRTGGALSSVDELMESGDHFEGRYLAESEEHVFFAVEDEHLPLPSTLSILERRVVALLVLDFSQAEVALRLGISRKRVRSAHLSVQSKMADWRPSGTELPSLAVAA